MLTAHGDCYTCGVVGTSGAGYQSNPAKYLVPSLIEAVAGSAIGFIDGRDKSWYDCAAEHHILYGAMSDPRNATRFSSFQTRSCARAPPTSQNRQSCLSPVDRTIFLPCRRAALCGQRGRSNLGQLATGSMLIASRLERLKN